MQGHETPRTIEPTASTSQRPASRQFWIWVAVVIVAVVMAGYAAFGGNSNAGGDTARTACHTRIENQLKSPGTADYSNENLSHGGGEWTLTGSVDSQNSFGGIVRNDFTCVATDSGAVISLTGLTH